MNQHHRFRECQDLAYRSAVRCAEREGKSTISQFYAKLGLTPSQADAVCFLSEEAGMTLAELARRSHVRKTSLARTMSELTVRGLVEVFGPGSSCPQPTLGPARYRLTPKGYRTVDVLFGSLPELHARVTEASRTAFARQYAQALKTYDRDGLLGAPDPRELN